MEIRRLYSMAAILFASFLTISLYQNCSKPLEPVGGVVDPTSTSFLELTVASGFEENPDEVDMNQDVVFHIKGLTSNELYGCSRVEVPSGDRCDGTNSVRIEDGPDYLRFGVAGAGSASLLREARDLANYDLRYSLSALYGFSVQIAFGQGDIVSKSFYIRPPHLTNNAGNEIVVWYSETGSNGRNRIWNERGRMNEVDITSGPHQLDSNIYMPPGQTAEVCIITYSGSRAPANSPPASQCSNWATIDKAPTHGDLEVTNNGGKWWHNTNTNLFTLNGGPNYVTYIRDKDTQEVLNYATTWVFVRE